MARPVSAANRRHFPEPPQYDTPEALFAAYEPARAQVRPPECNNGEKCWVRFGPPCYRRIGGSDSCVGCDARIYVR